MAEFVCTFDVIVPLFIGHKKLSEYREAWKSSAQAQAIEAEILAALDDFSTDDWHAAIAADPLALHSIINDEQVVYDNGDPVRLDEIVAMRIVERHIDWHGDIHRHFIAMRARPDQPWQPCYPKRRMAHALSHL